MRSIRFDSIKIFSIAKESIKLYPHKTSMKAHRTAKKDPGGIEPTTIGTRTSTLTTKLPGPMRHLVLETFENAIWLAHNEK